MYDYLVVGAGLFGSVFAREAALKGKKVKVIEKRQHIAGNCFTEEVAGIQVHQYGAHIFHTSNELIWKYINQFASFNHFTNAPIANYRGEIYNLPFNMNTFNKLWGVLTPKEAKDKIDEQTKHLSNHPINNLEDQAIALVGPDIYEKLIKHYTEKQWGRPCDELPAFIIKRLPVRYTYDNNYFSDIYQGIPIGGYTQIIEKMLTHSNIDVQLNTDFFDDKDDFLKTSKKVLYTGMIDQFYDYQYGRLNYRSLKFETTVLQESNYQGNAVVNFTDPETPYTRIIEHKHFEFGNQPQTVITKEFSKEWVIGDEPYYPINDEENNRLYERYQALTLNEDQVIFGGRLGTYSYLDMDKVIEKALDCAKNE